MMNLDFGITKHHQINYSSILNFRFSTLLCITMILLHSHNVIAETPLFSFKPGDKYLMTSVTEEKTTRIIDSNQQIINQTTRFECDLDIDEIDENGNVWAKYTYRRTAQKIKSPTVDLDFDSIRETKKIHLQALPMFLVIEEGLFVRINPQGRITQINGVQAVISNIKSKVPTMSENDKATFASFVNEMFSESAIKRTLEEQLAVFPEPNNRYQWSRNVEIPSKKIIQQWNYRLRNNKDVMIVDVNLTTTPSPDVDEVIRSGFKYIRQTSGQGRGQVEINPNASGSQPLIKSLIAQDLTEEFKALPQGPVLRVPKLAEPIQTHIETTFLMTRRPQQEKASEPNKPIDVNQ